MATAILELMAGLFNYRPSMLQRGIQQMLDGKNYYYFWWERLGNLFRYQVYVSDSLKKNIKGKESKIGFISNYLFKNNKNLVGVSDKILSKEEFLTSEFILQEIALQTLGAISDYKNIKSIKRGTLDKKANLFSSMVINHPIYKRSAGNTRLSPDPAYLSADKFSDIMIDILGKQMNDRLKSGPILMLDIKKNLDNLIQSPNSELKDILTIYIGQANGDLLRFRWLIELWYNDQMNRLVGWYKRQTSYLLFVIGLFLAISFNIDSVEIAHRLENNPDLANRLSDGATAYISNFKGNDFDATKTSKKLDTLYNRNLNESVSIVGLGWKNYGQPIDSLKDALDWQLVQLIDKIKQCDSVYCKQLDLLVPSRRFAAAVIKDSLKKIDEDYTVYLKRHDTKIISIKTSMEISFCQKFKYVLQSLIGIKLLGVIITALGISFGAQFWFDLLTKLVNLRSAGKKPEERMESNTSKTTKLNQLPDADSFG